MDLLKEPPEALAFELHTRVNGRSTSASIWEKTMEVDLTTEYLGISLRSPLVASSSPCTSQPDVLKRLEANGAGAAVLPSLFEEQIVREHLTPPDRNASSGDSHVSVNDFPTMRLYNRGSDSYARLVEDCRASVSMPIIASLCAVSPEGWLDYARRITDAGASAIELNLYFVPTDPSVSGQSIEAQYLEVVTALRQELTVPLSVKIGPYFSSLPYFARQVVDAGADGLVLFNRFLEPEVNLENQAVEPHLVLSQPSELRLSLRWLGILRDQLQHCNLGATGGIHRGSDALKALAVGADVVMITSVLLKNGADYLQTIEREMVEWLRDHGYGSVKQLRSTISPAKCKTPGAFERANYAWTLASYMDFGPCSS